MKKYFFTSIFVPAFLSIFVVIFSVPVLSNSNISTTTSDDIYIWPTGNYHAITSTFGYRKAPTKGASTYHSGIDIGAPEGTNVYSILDGIVTSVGFNGAGGCTVIISHNNNLTSYYSHLSQDFMVEKGEQIIKGQIIGTVGPKYLNNIKNNPYKDENGMATNGATTGPHLHFAVSLGDKKINPLTLF